MSRFGWMLLALLPLAAGCNGDDDAVVVIGDFLLIAFDDAGDLFTVDPGTGAETLARDTFYDPGTGAVDLGRVSAAVYVPARGEIWIGGGGNSPCTACILVLNTATGEATLLADNSGTNRAIPDLALRVSDGSIFTTEADGAGFRSVDPTTGTVANISATTNSGSGNGLTFDRSETLYLSADGSLMTVDPVTGADALVAALNYTGFPAFVGSPEVVAMTTDPNTGTVYGLVKDGGGGGGSKETYLATVNTATGEVTNIGKNGRSIEGLAFVPSAMVP